jgi:pimeloyl-ACP methyl ester carboxylesterase
MTTSAVATARARKSTPVRLSQIHLALMRGYFAGLERVAPRTVERQAAYLFCRPRRLEHRDVPPIPDNAHSFTVTSGTKQVRAWSWGDGPPALLAHGWEGTARDMVPLASALANRGFRVTVFDMPAHGSSTGRTTTLPEMARALAAVAAVSGTPTVLAGHSLGAAACVLALRDGVAAQRAALMAPVAGPWLFVQRLAALLAFSDERYHGLVERIRERAGVPLEHIDCIAATRSLTARAVIVHDPADRQVPYEQGQALAEAWRGAALHAIPGVGHRRVLFDGRAMNHLIQHAIAA